MAADFLVPDRFAVERLAGDFLAADVFDRGAGAAGAAEATTTGSDWGRDGGASLAAGDGDRLSPGIRRPNNPPALSAS